MIAQTGSADREMTARASSPLQRHELRGLIEHLPRAKLDHTPTALQDCRHLSRLLGGPRILIKRDDLTGLAFGGTKTRSIGFIMGEAVARGADTIITFGFAKLVSNHCRLVTTAAAKLGMKSLLVLGGKQVPQGQCNELLCTLAGAEVRRVATEDIPALEAVCNELALQLRDAGQAPFVVGIDKFYGSYGALGSAECLLEMLDQLDQMECRADYIYVCSQGGTQAGLVLTRKALHSCPKVVAISSMQPGLRSWPGRVELHADIARWANDLAKVLGIDVEVMPSDVVNSADYVGEGYGLATPECLEAIRLVARTEGIILDPLYTAKGMAGLIDHVRRNKIASNETVVFIHTGGTPTLFDHSDWLVS